MDRRYLRANMSVYACSSFFALRVLLIAFHRGSFSLSGKFISIFLTLDRDSAFELFSSVI